MTSKRLHQGPIFVQKSPIHGYGVFAAQDIAKDEIIEECHSLLMAKSHRDFENYFFKHPRSENKSLIPLGFGCIYNHSTTPNADHDYDQDRQLLIFYTLRDIRQGEELFTSYGPLWFSSREMKIKSPPWWRRLSHSLKMPLRFALLYLIYRGYLHFIS